MAENCRVCTGCGHGRVKYQCPKCQELRSILKDLLPAEKEVLHLSFCMDSVDVCKRRKELAARLKDLLPAEKEVLHFSFCMD